MTLEKLERLSLSVLVIFVILFLITTININIPTTRIISRVDTLPSGHHKVWSKDGFSCYVLLGGNALRVNDKLKCEWYAIGDNRNVSNNR